MPGLDTVDFWTNRQTAIPGDVPASLAILGAGAIGVEQGQAVARLGSKVTRTARNGEGAMKHEGKAYFDGFQVVPLVIELQPFVCGFRSEVSEAARFIGLSRRPIKPPAVESGAPVAVPATWKRQLARGH